jgi:hypothetical protein
MSLHARQHAAVDKQLARQRLQRTEGPGWYVLVEIPTEEGPKVVKVWATSIDEPRQNPPLVEHMRNDDLEQIADKLAQRFVENIATGVTPGYAEFSAFVRSLATCVFQRVEDKADADISDRRQEALSDLGEVAVQIRKNTMLKPR